jgi:HEPN domain-containing protein
MEKCYTNEARRRWQYFAHQDLQMAELALNEDIYNQVCFHSQQCVEKCLKGLLAGLGQKTPRTHSIVDLLRILQNIQQTECIDDLRESMELMDIYYIPTRYPEALPGSLAEGMPELDDALTAISTARACWKKLG